MKTIGLLGGMSWVSTIEYYRLINEAVAERLGGWYSAKCVLGSVDFAEIEAIQRSNNWETAGRVLNGQARAVEQAGADVLVLCTNTMHKVADTIHEGLQIPFLHIAEVTGKVIRESGLTKVGLLGTAYTMEMGFYSRPLKGMGIDVLVPEKELRDKLNVVIFDELNVESSSRSTVCEMVEDLRRKGCGGVILGCTEIPMLIGPEDVDVPVFDTTAIHADAAVSFALAGP